MNYLGRILIMLCCAVSVPVSAKDGPQQVAKQPKKTEIKIAGPAAEDLFLIVSKTPSKNISCTKVLEASCEVCAGGALVAVCTLNAQEYSDGR